MSHAIGDEAPEIIVPETETEEETTAGTQTAKQVNTESVLDMQQQLSNKIPQLMIPFGCSCLCMMII